MGLFVSLTLALVGVALALVLPPLLGRGSLPVSRRERVNAAIYREHLSEMAAGAEDVAMDEAKWTLERSALERAALRDLDGGGTSFGEVPENVEGGNLSGGSGDGKHTDRRRWAAVAVALVVPLAAFGLYFHLGNPAIFDDALFGPHGTQSTWDRGEDRSPAQSSGQAMGQGGDLAGSVEKLAARLAKAPDNPRGWLMLGRSYAVMEQPEKARAAFAQVEVYGKQAPGVLIDYAEWLVDAGMANGQVKAGELLRMALEREPAHPKGLWLAGVVAYRQGKPARAVRYWHRLQAAETLSEREREMLAKILADTRRALGSQAVE